jgi:hypothetical protein
MFSPTPPYPFFFSLCFLQPLCFSRVNAQVKSSSSSKAAIKMAHHQPQITKLVTHNKHKSPVTHKSPLSTTSSTSNPQQTQITHPTSSIKHQAQNHKTHQTLATILTHKTQINEDNIAKHKTHNQTHKSKPNPLQGGLLDPNHSQIVNEIEVFLHTTSWSSSRW